MSETNLNYEEIFSSVPVDGDTKITGIVYGCYDNIPVRIESWSWDGISACTCIISIASLKLEGTDHAAAIAVIKKALLITGQTTEKEANGYLFLNYNFEVL